MLQLLGILLHVGQRHLVRAPEAFQTVAVDFLRERSSPWASAARSSASAGASTGRVARAPRCWMSRISLDAVLDRRGHGLVHAVVVGAFDEIRRPAVAAHQALQLLVR